ncbi:vacuolar protein sorting/targeting protein PEP1, partial [Nowakowskiella sp. JEL0078]
VTNVAELTSDKGKSVKKKVRSLVSFDDGSTWNTIPAPTTDVFGKSTDCTGDCSLHLFSHSNIHPSLSTTGTVTSALHSTKEAIGLMLAVGNIGSQLVEYNEGNMYLTRDAGQSWVEVHKDAHKFALGDHGTLIVLVNDEGPTDRIIYSWDFGTSWAEFKISEKPIRVKSLVSIPSSTKFVLIGNYPGATSTSSVSTFSSSKEDKFYSNKRPSHNGRSVDFGSLESRGFESRGFDTEAVSATDTVLLHLDFSSLFANKCVLDKNSPSKSDFETWAPRGAKGERCFLGRDIEYTRRKRDRMCFVGLEWTQLPQKEEICQCSQSDFLCDVNFWRDDQGKCALYGLDPKQPKNCKSGTIFKGSSGYRKIGLSKCVSGVNLEKDTPDRVCGEKSSGGGPGNVAVSFKEFSNQLIDYHYFNKSQTIIFIDMVGSAFISYNEGLDWEPAVNTEPATDKVVSLTPDPYLDNRAFLVTLGKLLWITEDKGKKWNKITPPTPANHFMIPPLSIHPTKSDWLLWIGDSGCTDDQKGDCRTQAYYSSNKGGSWKLLREYVLNCQWGRTEKYNLVQEDTVFCLSFKEKKGDFQTLLLANDLKNPIIFERTQNWGSAWTSILERGVGFAFVEEFMVVAQLHTDRKEILMKVSIDGVEWADAVWPPNFRVPDYGYTVLQSTTGRLVVDVNTEVQKQREQYVPLWGNIFRSNSNGTNFTVSIDHTNRDSRGYVDFEKMQSIEGIALVNQVINTKEVLLGSTKEIRSKITFNDGNTWVDLIPPSFDSNGKGFECKDKCFLNLHAYTERQDKRDQFSSSSAPGLMVAVGNVGEYLSEYKLGDMFLTRDAGKTWKEIAKEAHMYEFGDHGGILVLVNNEEPTDIIK